VGFITLGMMIAPSVWGKGKIRLYPVLFGLLGGFGSALLLGVLTWRQLENNLSAPLFSLPHRQHLGWPIAPAFILTFVVTSMGSMLKTIGDITLCQKINDADWRRTEMRSVSGGILAGATCTTVSGLLGGMGQSTFSSNVGLSMATGVTSRVVAYPMGLILIALAFFPKLAGVFAGMPAPVMGAVLVYVASYMIVGGIQVITSRMLDARKIYVVGISLIFGLSVEIVPQVYQSFPPFARPFVTSALTLTTITVVVLNMLMRIGIAKRQQIAITCGPEASDAVFAFMGRQGTVWGMRPEVANSAIHALDELMTALQGVPLRSPTVQVAAEFDEFNLEIDVDYEGPPINLPGVLPSNEEITAKRGEVALAGFMVRHRADDVKVIRLEGRSRVHMHFEH
jgi:NCS2 family nucleobase:cation symporter-2